jgi:hypothetical protein
MVRWVADHAAGPHAGLAACRRLRQVRLIRAPAPAGLPAPIAYGGGAGVLLMLFPALLKRLLILPLRKPSATITLFYARAASQREG